jgi:hypothetical protein
MAFKYYDGIALQMARRSIEDFGNPVEITGPAALQEALFQLADEYTMPETWPAEYSGEINGQPWVVHFTLETPRVSQSFSLRDGTATAAE